MGALLAGRAVRTPAHLVAGTVLFLALTLVASPMLAETRQEEAHSGQVRLRRLPAALIALSAIGFCIFLSEGAIADWTAVYLKQVQHTSDGLAPIGYAVFAAAMATFRFAGDAITTRIGSAWTIRAGGAVAAAGLSIVVAAHSPFWALIGFAFAGAGFSSIIPLVFAAGGRIEGVSEGAGVATVSGLGYLGFLAGPPAIGFVSELSSLRGGLFLLVVLSASASLLVSVALPKRARYTAQRAARPTMEFYGFCNWPGCERSAGQKHAPDPVGGQNGQPHQARRDPLGRWLQGRVRRPL